MIQRSGKIEVKASIKKVLARNEATSLL